MPNYLTALKRGFAAAVSSATTAHSFSATGKKIVCLHCGEDKFFRGNALIDRNRLIKTDWVDDEPKQL